MIVKFIFDILCIYPTCQNLSNAHTIQNFRACQNGILEIIEYMIKFVKARAGNLNTVIKISVH